MMKKLKKEYMGTPGGWPWNREEKMGYVVKNISAINGEQIQTTMVE
jgi:hypothetical protein